MMKLLKTCRVCGGTNLTEYLDLGLMPLSNNLMKHANDQASRFPLALNYCNTCGLSQLSTVIDPHELFSHYVYRSSISAGYRNHCRQMAIELATMYLMTTETFHVDIAGNDGALLIEFRKIYGHEILNVDPAENLHEIAEAKGVPTLSKFWSMNVAQAIVRQFGPVDLITATNVFAHVDRIYDFLRGIHTALSYDGIAVLEFPYLCDFIEKNEFDTVYFEHLSYFLVKPLAYAASKVGLGITHLSKQDIHGGSLRVVMQKHRMHDPIVENYIRKETADGFHDVNKYINWQQNIVHIVKTFREKMITYSKAFKIAAFGASAKGNTLLNSAGITIEQIKFIIDETPEKIDKYSPGTGIPIYGLNSIASVEQIHHPELIVLLAWNFADECMKKCRDAGFQGRFIHPLTMEII